MANKKRVIWVAGIVLLFTARAGLAQDFPRRAHDFNYFQPFGPIDVDYYHDAQPFAPANVSMFDDGPGANEGFFFKYQRLNLNVDRPDASYADWTGDWGWGNRYEVGYMTEDDHGWLVDIWNVDGPRVGRDFDDDDVLDEVNNDMDLSGVSVYKVWRLEQYHYGAFLEPFVGLAYKSAHQKGFDYSAKNDMWGGEVGLRLYKQLKRWTVSTEGRAFAGLNHQEVKFLALADDSEEFVYSFDLRVEATYELTKAVALNVGYEMMFFPDSIARDNVPEHQDLYATGVTFGISVNR